MKIVVNGQARDLSVECTGQVLLDVLDLGAERIAVEQNGEVKNRQTFAVSPLCEGDVIEIVRFVGGG